MKVKRNITFFFFLLSGIIVGALIASLVEDIWFLNWLCYGKTIGISTANPFILDLSLVRLAFGCEIGVNVAQIITITASLVLYKRVASKL
ncbi:MAG: DUF4321 domain-containing protein [Oscillospiraceae bacterium]|nr:DUF4321 domain-containing protein [Oscillospiraceae bacterium]